MYGKGRARIRCAGAAFAERRNCVANKILTPITLWGDFNDALPLQAKVLGESTEDGVSLSRVRFFGRAVGEERVDIFALLAKPSADKECPAVLILSDCHLTADKALLKLFAKRGYAVLMPDYRGVWGEAADYTVYPQAISYANYSLAGRHFSFADETARETCWYEWTALARYCVRYLREQPFVTRVGAVGLKAGGEVVWQLAATCDLACAVTVCAGGWRAYRGILKYGENTELKMDDERYRFLAGVESQSYAQYARCPMLMLCATNDENLDADRAFDTYARINPEMPKSFYFAARYDGHIGNTGLNDLFQFAEKYLKEKDRFLPEPVAVTIEEDEGELVARVSLEHNTGGRLDYCDVFMAEDNPDASTRDWTICPLKRDEKKEGMVFYLNAYKNAVRVFAFAKAKYKSGFAVSSKIAVKRIEKQYANMTDRSRILYSSENGRDSFTIDNTSGKLLADCFLNNDTPPVVMVDGPHGIRGIYSAYGLKLFRINEERYRPAEGALLKFDLYSPQGCALRINLVVFSEGGAKEVYACTLTSNGGECWSNFVVGAKDFKNEVNKPLGQIRDAKYITFNSDGEFCINNLLWL